MPFSRTLSMTFAGLLAAAMTLVAQTAPKQPATGPGGANYSNAGVTTLGPFYPAGKQGQDVYRYFIYQPASPKPATAPIILFLHGANANYPDTYTLWFNHMVKKGYTVIWVQYQAMLSPERDYYTNAHVSYADALSRIQNDPTMVQPMKDQNGQLLTGFVGHSMGSYVAMVLAGRSTSAGLSIPVPKAYFSANAGFAVAQTDYQSIPASTKVVFLVGADDDVVCKSSTELLFNLIPQVPLANKKFLVMQSQVRGAQGITADHFFATTVPVPPPAIDARDFYGSWKLSVATMDCGIKGTNCEYTTANGSQEQLSMGNWSDGQPVTPLLYAPTPASVILPCEGLKSPRFQ